MAKLFKIKLKKCLGIQPKTKRDRVPKNHATQNSSLTSQEKNFEFKTIEPVI